MSAQEDRILQLLGQGLQESVVASAVGVTPSAISQLLSRQDFAEAVAELRYKTLAAHTHRDNSYDELEDTLLEKLKSSVSLMYKPAELLKAVQIVNAAKRRGQAAPDHLTQQQTVINLQIPVKVVNKFTLTSNKQVIEAGSQALNTMQSSTLSRLFEQRGSQNERPELPTPEEESRIAAPEPQDSSAAAASN